LTVQTENRFAVAALLANRLVYSINWFCIPPVFYLIAADLHLKLSGLGLISSAFLVGVGLFQVPAVLLSARYSQRTACLVGMILLSGSTVLCAAVSDIWTMAFLRFFSGVGMAFFFSPSIALMISNARTGSMGFVLGLNTAVASLGGGIGLFGWALIGGSVGWRPSLVLVGALGLVSTLFIMADVPQDTRAHDFPFRPPDLKRVLLDRWLLLIGASMLAYNIGNTLVATFAVVYLHDSLGLAAGPSGGLGSLVVLGALFTAPIAGRFHGRVVNVRLVLAYAGLAIAAGVAVASLSSPAAVVIAGLTVGLVSGVGYTFGYGAAWNSFKVTWESSLAMSWINFIILLFSAWAPYVFSSVVESYGYEVAWLTGGLYTAIFALPILFSRVRPEARPDSF
jgi:predicted MFS family arabinose efflux permease